MNHSREFRELLRHKVKHSEKGPLVESFPGDPRELANFESLYEDEKPSSQEIVGTLGVNSAKLPARITHKEVRPNATSALLPVSSGAAGSKAQQQQMNQMQQMFCAMMGQWAAGMSSGGSSSSGGDTLPGLQVFANRRQQKCMQKALEPGQTVATKDQDKTESQNDSQEPSPPAAAPAAQCPAPEAPCPAPKAPPAANEESKPPPITSPEDQFSLMEASFKERENQKDDARETEVKKRPSSNVKSKSAPSPKKLPKAKAKAKAKTLVKKKVSIVKAKHGWIVEERTRPTGQVDRHYKSPDGSQYRILHEAQEAGFEY